MALVRLIASRDVNVLLPHLREAEEGDTRIIQVIGDPSSTSYLAMSGETCVGAVVMCWAQDVSEIIYIQTAPAFRGQGYGKLIIRGILDEAWRRGVESLCVGTANAALSNIAFYQKCGFRMDSVRKDFFNYFTSPVYENGILIQDMLVLRLLVSEVRDQAAER